MHPVPQQPRSRERGGPSPRFLSPAAGGKVVGSVANRAFLMSFSEKLAFFETWGIFLC